MIFLTSCIFGIAVATFGLYGVLKVCKSTIKAIEREKIDRIVSEEAECFTDYERLALFIFTFSLSTQLQIINKKHIAYFIFSMLLFTESTRFLEFIVLLFHDLRRILAIHRSDDNHLSFFILRHHNSQPAPFVHQIQRRAKLHLSIRIGISLLSRFVFDFEDDFGSLLSQIGIFFSFGCSFHVVHYDNHQEL